MSKHSNKDREALQNAAVAELYHQRTNTASRPGIQRRAICLTKPLVGCLGDPNKVACQLQYPA